MSREQDYISAARTAAKNVWDGINTLKSLQREWNALDYGNTLADGEGANAGVTRAEVGAVVFDSANALETTLNTGHATNFAKVL